MNSENILKDQLGLVFVYDLFWVIFSIKSGAWVSLTNAIIELACCAITK